MPVAANRRRRSPPAAAGGPVRATGAGRLAVLVALAASGSPAAAVADGEVPPLDGDALDELTGVNLALALLDAGRVNDAATLAVERWERAGTRGAVHARVGWALALGTTQAAQGRMAAARRCFEEAAQLAPSTAAGRHGTRWAVGGALYCSTQLGDLGGARELAGRLDALAAHDAIVHDGLGIRGQAWLRALDGDPDGATAFLVDQAHLARSRGYDTQAVHLLGDVARLGHAARAAPVLAGLAVDGDMLPVLVDSIGTVARRDHGHLAAIAERLHTLGAALLAAEAANAAWTIARRDDADPRVVAARQRRAQELAAPLPALATPGLAAPSVTVHLSRREREIATLVSEGRTSREVAATLVIGVRTVESHLARIYAKLGISSRAELGEALGLIGVAP